MAIEIDFSYVIDGLFDSVNYYRSETPMNPESMPVATATGITVTTYTDTTATKGTNYYVRFGSVGSGVEKISNEYRVLAGTAWTPDNLLNAPKLRTDSDNVLISSTQVTQLTDLSGNNYHFTQSTESYRPTLQFDSGINHNVIVFDGVDDDLRNLNAQAIARNISKFWSFAVYKKQSTDGTGQFRTMLQFCRGDSSGANARLGVYSGFSTAANAGAISVRPVDGVTSAVSKTGAAKAEIWTLLFSQWDGDAAQMSLSQDGVFNSSSASGIATTTSDTAPSVTPATIGCGAAGTDISTSGFADIPLACLIVGSGSLPSESERQKLEGWAAHKYGLTGNLPSDHPYKVLVPTV